MGVDLAAATAAISRETEEAIRFANHVLDDPGRDPDSNVSVLARQFLRARERLDQFNEAKASIAWSQTEGSAG